MAKPLIDGGTVERLLEESKRFAGSMAEGLRVRIYEEVIPVLAEGLAKARGLRKPSPAKLAETYEMAMTVLFRLLFIAYGEDKDLLPYRWNELYRHRSLKHKARELLEMKLAGTRYDDSDSLWEEVSRLFRAVEKGHTEWGIPEYDGGLFSSEPEVSPIGAALADVRLPNTIMEPVLEHLLLVGTRWGGDDGPLDFRSISVREFGTVYEGLLEQDLAVAEADLALDENDRYRPCKMGETPVVRREHIYLHNKSGARKATGSYFTKAFAVEHLLDQALEPALADHIQRLDAIADDHAAAEAFFDFRVADIAMGSGHFLVAAVDRIERGLSSYLARRPLAGVRQELLTLRKSAREALGPLADQIEDQIEDTQLLRRLIARRCIYGVDLNAVAVHLARLSIWIHTFVPGLPLSLLDHNLVVGNSLVGIGRVAEIEDKAREDDLPLFKLEAKTLVGAALEPLQKLARIADATMADVRRARKAYEQARQAVRPAEALCDIVTVCRMTGERLSVNLEHWNEIKDTLPDSEEHRKARTQIGALSPLHFPVAFPEVFLRQRQGFDVILGNPPWEEATVEEHAFWARHEPGLRGLNQREQERLKASLRRTRPDLVEYYDQEVAQADAMRSALLSGPYPGMGTGDPDLYKAFCWRFWQLTVPSGGRFGVVLARPGMQRGRRNSARRFSNAPLA
ncbi:MAG: hypothetical protein HYS13_05125 [Planctomycetia bacterium]|nr:hypothetical protein [Planctomycetia bacterium]